MNIFSRLAASFEAFNKNAVYSIIYIMQRNVWFILIAAAALASIVMMLKEEMDYSVHEEQNII